MRYWLFLDFKTYYNVCYSQELLDADIRQQIYQLQLEHIRELAASSADLSDGAPSRQQYRHYNYQSHRHNSAAGIDGEEAYSQPPVSVPGRVTFGEHTLPRRPKNSSRRCSPATARATTMEAASSSIHKRASFYDSASKPIYISKCLCLITRLPIVYSSENLLRYLHSLLYNKNTTLRHNDNDARDGQRFLPLESVVYWALHEVPLPLPGTCLQVTYDACNLVVKRPPAMAITMSSELPIFFDYPLQSLFALVGVERFIKLFTCFLLEHQILICSKCEYNFITKN